MKTELLTEGFKNWLQTLNYAENTVYTSVRFADDFLNWLETQNINQIAEVNKRTVKKYFNYLKNRKNKRFGIGLSINYLRGYMNALKRFARYLRETQNEILEIEISLPVAKPEKTILTKTEIEMIYKAIENSILGYRDKAMLAVYYGCGLRRSEGINLDVNDILFERKVIHVRKGKNYKERFTPMSEGVCTDLHAYIHHARTFLTKENNEKALFVSEKGKRLNSNTLIERLHKLVKQAEINKSIGLHSLRHSIATHLLQSGMKLEFVSQFLGHSTLESTQIYTHIVNYEL